MDSFNEALQVMAYLFGKDYQFALATSKNNIPSVRFVDTFYKDQSFYLVTSKDSKKVEEITLNPKVALTNRLYRFSGEAEILEQPLNQTLSDIRSSLSTIFLDWYFAQEEEETPNICFIKITLVDGFFYHDKVGYKVDFKEKTVSKVPFELDRIPLN